MSVIATDPPVSQKQRAAMHAAVEGHSTLGIPQSVGEEYSSADPGGKLPASAKDSPASLGWLRDLKSFARGLMSWAQEEDAETEHDELPVGVTAPNSGVPPLKKPAEDDAPKGRAASAAFFTPEGKVLFVKRSPTEENWPDTWSWPGGRMDDADGGNTYDTVRRECEEELGLIPEDDGQWTELEKKQTPHGWEHTTYACPTEEFEPTLNGEHTEHVWAGLDDLPEPLHPGVKATLDGLRERLASDADFRKAAGGMYQAFVNLSPLLNRSAKLARVTPEEIEEQDRQPTANVARDSRFIICFDEEPTRDGEGRFVVSAEDPLDLLGAEDDEDADDTAAPKVEVPTAKKREPRIDNRLRAPRLRITTGDTRFVIDLAQDKDTVRSFDDDQRMHVEKSNLTKANCCPYWGREIPGFEELKLDPEKQYNLYRHPDELAKPETVASFNRIPVLERHIPMDAANHNDKSSHVIGTTGSDAVYEHPYMSNSLAFWPQHAIDDIESKRKKELSSGYHYTPDMTPGETEDGEKYDGVMRNIRAQHVALVPEGRVGSDVVVADTMSAAYSWADLERALCGLDQRRAA